MYYYQNPSDTSPLSGFGCYVENFTQNIYKQTSVGTNTAPASAASSTFTFGSTFAGSQPTSSSNGGQSSSHGNNAWIAGVVIGTVVGVAIIAGAAFWIWYLYRKMSRTQTSAPRPDMASPPVQQYSRAAPPPYVSEPVPHTVSLVQELPAQGDPHELYE
jgi:hypothetical protein